MRLRFAILRPLHTPAWRNWQTRWTQNPLGLTPRAGSIPVAGICGAHGCAFNARHSHRVSSWETPS